MITPSPTTRIDPGLMRGILEAVVPATATRPGFVKISAHNSSTVLHLIPEGEIASPVGKKIIGVIRAKARRIDTVGTGGRYVEPVLGPPQRVQGRVIAIEPDAIVVDAGVPIHATPTDPRQSARGFAVDDFVSFDVLEGASFAPA